MPEQSQQLDHDLLIELRTEMRAIREDIKNMRDDISGSVSDHETRIRDLEKLTDDYKTVKKIVYGAVTLILIAFLGAVISFFVAPKTVYSDKGVSINEQK